MYELLSRLRERPVVSWTVCIDESALAEYGISIELWEPNLQSAPRYDDSGPEFGRIE